MSVKWPCLEDHLCYQWVNFAWLVLDILCHLLRCDSLVILISCSQKDWEVKYFYLGEGIPNVKIVFKPLYLMVNITYFLERRLSKAKLSLNPSKNQSWTNYSRPRAWRMLEKSLRLALGICFEMFQHVLAPSGLLMIWLTRVTEKFWK